MTVNMPKLDIYGQMQLEWGAGVVAVEPAAADAVEAERPVEAAWITGASTWPAKTDGSHPP